MPKSALGLRVRVQQTLQQAKLTDVGQRRPDRWTSAQTVDSGRTPQSHGSRRSHIATVSNVESGVVSSASESRSAYACNAAARRHRRAQNGRSQNAEDTRPPPSPPAIPAAPPGYCRAWHYSPVTSPCSHRLTSPAPHRKPGIDLEATHRVGPI